MRRALHQPRQASDSCCPRPLVDGTPPARVDEGSDVRATNSGLVDYGTLPVNASRVVGRRGFAPATRQPSRTQGCGLASATPVVASPDPSARSLLHGQCSGRCHEPQLRRTARGLRSAGPPPRVVPRLAATRLPTSCGSLSPGHGTLVGPRRLKASRGERLTPGMPPIAPGPCGSWQRPGQWALLLRAHKHHPRPDHPEPVNLPRSRTVSAFARRASVTGWLWCDGVPCRVVHSRSPFSLGDPTWLGLASVPYRIGGGVRSAQALSRGHRCRRSRSVLSVAVIVISSSGW